VIGQQVHHHHGKPGARGDEHDVAAGFDKPKAKFSGGALGRRHGPLGEHAAYRKFLRVVAEGRAVVANDLGVAGDECALRRHRERVDLKKLEVFLAGDVGKPGGISGNARGKRAGKQFGDLREHAFRRRLRRNLDRDARKPGGSLDVLAAFGRQQQFELLPRAVDANGNENLLGDRHRFFQEERRVGVVKRGENEPPRLVEGGERIEAAHQAALAAAAFEYLRLEEMPVPARSLVRRHCSRGEQHAARCGEAVAAQQGFSVVFDKTHNAVLSAPFGVVFGVYRMSGPLRLPFLDPEPWRVAVIAPTGRYARSQVAGMIEAGTPFVGGVALGRSGETTDGLPLYDRVADLPEKPNIALIYTPAEGVRDAVAGCARAGVATIMAVAEYVPVHDALAAAALARQAGSWLIGPNTLGICVPARGLLGSIAPSFCKAGRVAVIVRSGTVALALARQLTLAGVGQRLVVHVGGDAVIGRNPDEYLHALAGDEATEAVLFCGEIGGDKEYAFAEAARDFAKPIVAMVVGRHAPAQREMGHAGALIGSAREGAAAKLEALAGAGCRIAKGPAEAAAALAEFGFAAD
jgi:succinyl-CoA synthetase alpha subunit